MYLTDLNTQGGIGANSLLVEIGPFRIVVDAGVNPKLNGKDALPQFRPVFKDHIDLVVLTHCHLDHLGALPILLRDYPEVPLVMSPASRLLFRRMLHNSRSVMDKQMKERGNRTIPLFNRADIERLQRQAFALNCGQPRFFTARNGDRLTLTLYPAGHLPGAVSLMLEYQHRKILFTGDLLFTDQAILPGAKIPEDKVDTVILETTRGSTEREPGATRSSEVERLCQTIEHTLSHGGSVLIPVFALGRMQEILTIFHQARALKRLPKVPIYSSGLGIDLVDYFEEIAVKHGGLWFRRKIMQDLGVQRMQESHRPGSQGPAIYLVSSGMMVPNTPSYGTCAALLGHHQNAVCFVGYCDPDTPGGKLLAQTHGTPFLFSEINRIVPIQARVEKFDLSSHADREELIDFTLARSPRAVVLTHGDPKSRDWFTQTLTQTQPNLKVTDPIPLQRTLI